MFKNFPSLIVLIALSITAFCADLVAKPKVLYIDSYHEGYAWSDGITKGVQKSLGDKVELKVHRMDTKRNGSEEFKTEAGKKAKAVIDDWKPDVVIVSDDNACKYMVVPFFKDADLPIVFCGVNWDATVYGFPCKNVCGMEEVALVKPLLAQLEKEAKGKKIGFIGPDILTAKKEHSSCEKKFDIKLDAYFAKDFEDWKKGFKKLQETCDMVIIDSDGGMYKEKEAEMKAFVHSNTTKPTGALYDFMSDYALYSYAKIAEEHGEWSGAVALRVIAGEKPEAIGAVQSKKGQLYVNLPIAKKLGVKVPLALMKSAVVKKD